jgi:hypothetical protein
VPRRAHLAQLAYSLFLSNFEDSDLAEKPESAGFLALAAETPVFGCLGMHRALRFYLPTLPSDIFRDRIAR